MKKFLLLVLPALLLMGACGDDDTGNGTEPVIPGTVTMKTAKATESENEEGENRLFTVVLDSLTNGAGTRISMVLYSPAVEEGDEESIGAGEYNYHATSTEDFILKSDADSRVEILTSATDVESFRINSGKVTIKRNGTGTNYTISGTVYGANTTQESLTFTYSGNVTIDYIDPVPPVSGEIKVEPSKIEALDRRATYEFKITSEDAWELADAPEWMTVRTESGPAGETTVTVYVEANDVFQPRNGVAKFIITGGGESDYANLAINQNKSYDLYTEFPYPELSYISDALYGNSNLDLNNDGRLSAWEAAQSVKELTTNANRVITDDNVDYLLYFPSLEVLEIKWTKNKYLDLSQHTKLKYLMYYIADELEEITFAEEGYPDLEYLDIRDTYKLKNWDWSKTPNLKALRSQYKTWFDDIPQNVLQSLEILELQNAPASFGGTMFKGLPNLKDLSLWECALTTLDVSNCTNLVNLDISNCRSLSSLNVEGCTNLKRLPGQNNQFPQGFTLPNLPNLNYIRLSNNKNIQTFDISHLTKLDTVILTNCGLTSLDLSNNNMIRSLSVGRNPNIGTLDVSHLTTLETIIANSNNFEDGDLVLGTHPALVRIDIDTNQFRTFDVSSCPKLATITMRYNYFREFDISHDTPKNLKQFDIRNQLLEVGETNPDEPESIYWPNEQLVVWVYPNFTGGQYFYPETTKGIYKQKPN